MISRVTALRLIIIGGVLVIIGAVLPFVMVMRLVEPTFVLVTVSFLAQVFGVVGGLCGIAMRHVELSRRDRED